MSIAGVVPVKPVDDTGTRYTIISAVIETRPSGVRQCPIHCRYC